MAVDMHLEGVVARAGSQGCSVGVTGGFWWQGITKRCFEGESLQEVTDAVKDLDGRPSTPKGSVIVRQTLSLRNDELCTETKRIDC